MRGDDAYEAGRRTMAEMIERDGLDFSAVVDRVAAILIRSEMGEAA